MPNPKLETYKNKATGDVYDFTDADAQGKLTVILDGTNIDSFGDVESALADKVDVVAGKGLSTNDYDDTEKAKVAGAFPRSEQAVLGAKNLLENTAITQTVADVVFTVNDDKTISLAQTASANAIFQVGIAYLKAGTYRIYSGFKGSGTTGNFTGVGIMVNKTEGAYDYYLIDQDYVDVTLNDDGYIVYKIRIASGTDTTGFKIYPMITLGSNTDSTYAPYAMTNRELTDNKIGVVREITSSENLDNITDYGVYSIKSTPTNAPDSESYVSLLVTPCATIGSGAVVQTIFAHGHAIYSRTKTGNPLTWEPWYKFTGTVVS